MVVTSDCEVPRTMHCNCVNNLWTKPKVSMTVHLCACLSACTFWPYGRALWNKIITPICSVFFL